nr:MAG TPA: hypothetical protein [Caudoviricetes sp.]
MGKQTCQRFLEKNVHISIDFIRKILYDNTNKLNDSLKQRATL